MRVVKAVDKRELYDLVNVVVFSKKGMRDLPSCLAGGDLDRVSTSSRFVRKGASLWKGRGIGRWGKERRKVSVDDEDLHLPRSLARKSPISFSSSHLVR